MTRHTAETSLGIVVESSVTAKVGAKGEAHLNLLAEATDDVILDVPADLRAAMLSGPSVTLAEVDLRPMNREQRRAAKKKRP